MRRFILPTLLSLLFSGHVILTYGQSAAVASKELTWHSNELNDKSNSKKIASPHRLVTHGQTSMELHRGNEQTLTFKILSVTGDWSDEKAEGMLVYNVRYSTDVLGKVTLERKGTSVKAWIDFTQGNKNGMNVEFIIDAVD
jgi:hypothetical protein